MTDKLADAFTSAIDENGYFETTDGVRYQLFSAKQCRRIKQALTEYEATKAATSDDVRGYKEKAVDAVNSWPEWKKDMMANAVGNKSTDYLIRDLDIIRVILESSKHTVYADFQRIDRLKNFIRAALRNTQGVPREDFVEFVNFVLLRLNSVCIYKRKEDMENLVQSMVDKCLEALSLLDQHARDG